MKSVCEDHYFSGKHRHCIYLIPMDLSHPCLFICHGALGRAGYCPVSYCLDVLTELPKQTSDLTHYQPHPGCSTEPSPSLPWPCARAWEHVLLGGTVLPTSGPPPWIPACCPKSSLTSPWRCRCSISVYASRTECMKSCGYLVIMAKLVTKGFHWRTWNGMLANAAEGALLETCL